MIRRTASVLVFVAVLALATGCSGAEPTPPPSDASSVAPEAPSSPPPTAGPAEDIRDIVAELPAESWQDALAAARAEFDGDVTKIEIERLSTGGWEYKIELVSADTEYVVQYDADTLEKITEERDSLGDDAEDIRKAIFDPEAVVSLNDAADTARAEQEGPIVEWKIEGDDLGRTIYEFDILAPGSSDDVEVKVDALDGSLIGLS